MSTAPPPTATMTAELTEIGWLLVVAFANFLAFLILSRLGVPQGLQFVMLPAGTMVVAAKQFGVQ